MRILLAIALTLLAWTGSDCTRQEIDDSSITTKVKTALATDKDTSAIKISVTTQNGVVILTGVVPTETEKARAGEIARKIEGVKGVENNITVDPRSVGATNVGKKVGEATERAAEKISEATESTREALSDTSIQAKIKSQLLINGMNRTHVDVRDGNVTLTGQVDTAQDKSNAEDMAKRTKGVRSVKNDLTIKK